jgi:hypothetical protein
MQSVKATVAPGMTTVAALRYKQVLACFANQNII